MNKGYFEFGYLILVVGYAAFAWLERSSERLEAVATATQLRGYLTGRLGSDVSDSQALSYAGDIEHFLKSEGGTFFVVLFAIIALLALRSFAKTELSSAMMATFSRSWTWRP